MIRRALLVELEGYILGHIAGLDWLFDPANQDAALALLRRNLPRLNQNLAERSYRVLLHSKNGFARRAELDVPGIATVLSLRQEYGEPRVALPEPAAFYDLTAYNKTSRRYRAS